MLQLKEINSPFNQEQVAMLNQLLPTLTEPQKLWLSGYFAASPLNAAQGSQAVLEAGQGPSLKEATILYGSQTGNAQALAKQAAQTLEGQGYQVTLSSMGDYKGNQLKKTKVLLVLVSTHGEGDPPDTAIPFYEFLLGRRAPKLEELHFSVLALGDSSYEFYCHTGKEMDARLEELGGTRLYPRVDCDLDYDEPAAEWLEGVVKSLQEVQGQEALPAQTSALAMTEASVYSRTNPFNAEILEMTSLNGRGSNKQTVHMELSLEGSGLTYEPGDSLGILPNNDVALVEQLLEELPWGPDESVTVSKQGDILSLKEAFTSHYEITVLTKQLLEKIHQLSPHPILGELLAAGNEIELKSFMEGRDLLDLVREIGPWGASAQEFVSQLRRIPARLYSICSSLTANPEEVHLTIGAVSYEAHGRERKGVCSTFCIESVQPGDRLAVYVQHNENFKLPQQADTPIIMIGPGTGIAPFRAFMQEREESGAEGKSWLFFGDQHYRTDFLYQVEWQQFLKKGVLSKMSIAFSRDQAEKVYVQHRMLEQSAELYAWLEEGAAVYVCGDEKNMAADVQEALIQIIETEGGKTREQAEAYLAEMKQQKRYQRDVY